MSLTFIPLLAQQRDLYRLPRGMDRFRAYLKSMVNATGDDLEIPPLVAMNPMARDHVPRLLDEYIALAADQAAADTLAAATPQLVALDDDQADCCGRSPDRATPADQRSPRPANAPAPLDGYHVSLVVLDDLQGGWTNRHVCEYQFRFGASDRTGERAIKRSRWLTAPLWSSDPASVEAARQSALLTALRANWRHHHGPPKTIRHRLAQEGACLLAAGCTTPTLDLEEIEYTRYVIEPHLEATDMPTTIACFFGDTPAKSLGFPTLGLSTNAGLALARHEATWTARAR